jgi:hypothetical protein
VIVGTACVRVIGGSDDPVGAAKKFAQSFSEALQMADQ